MNDLFFDTDKQIELKQRINKYSYYIIIVIISLITTFIPPILLGTINGDVSFCFPKTVDGWILWTVINGSSSLANICILILFKMQAKKNSQDNVNFKEANRILAETFERKYKFKPRSPAEMNRNDYVSKAIVIVFVTVFSFITVSSLVLSFDIVSLISTLLSTIITVLFSWVTMLKNEEYWKNEFLMYAKYMEQKEKENKNDNCERQDV